MYIYLEHEPASDELLTGISMDGFGAGIGGDQLSILRTLQNLVIDTSIFESKVWNTFYDSGHEIKEQPVSRTNPFAPISVNEVTVSVSTTTTQ